MRPFLFAALLPLAVGVNITALCAPQYNVTSTCVIANRSVELSPGSFVLNGSLVVSNSTLSIAQCASSDCAQSTWNAQIHGNVQIMVGSTLILASSALTVDGSMTVDASSSISLNGQGPSATGDEMQGKNGGGGSNGGLGTACYGSPYSSGNAIMADSFYFGGGSGSPADGVPGGGRLQLTVNGSLVLLGSVTANGNSPPTNTPEILGGAAGGSILLSAAKLTLGATGVITATGAGTFRKTAGGLSCHLFRADCLH